MKKKIVRYLLKLISYLDGRGLVVSDDDLLRETLENDFGEFSNLQKITRR